MAYKELQEQFQQAVISLSGNNQAEQLIKNHARLSTKDLLFIYQRNYRRTLEDTILGIFPATASLLGKENMQAAIESYLASTYSTSTDINAYGKHFPASLPNDSAANALAQLEWAIDQAYYLPTSKPLTPAQARQLDETSLMQANLKPAASAQLLTVDYPAHELLQSYNQNEDIFQASSKPHTTSLIVFRNGKKVFYEAMETQENQLLEALRLHNSFAEALEDWLAQQSDADSAAQSIQAYFQKWVSWGLLTLKS